MTREEFETYVLEAYGVSADYPFSDDFTTGVFRHEDGKWFAIAMRVSASKLGHDRDEEIDVVNMKCAPEVIDSLVGSEPGIYRAYHMNKLHWLTIALAEATSDTIAWLLSISFDLTRKQHKTK